MKTKRFVLSQNGKEVKLGDTLVKYNKINVPIGNGFSIQEIIVNETTLPELVTMGIIKPITPEISNVPTQIEFYIEKIANKMGWKIEKAGDLLDKINSILPVAAFSMILREIATELDKKYEDHIEKSPEIYVISMTDGRITKVNKAHIKNYRNFAAFRSIEDAKIACRIVAPILKEMFKNTSEK